MPTLDELRSRASPDQIRLVTLIWDHYLSNGKWIPRRLVHHQFRPNGRMVAGEAMRALGGSIVYEGWEQGEVYRVTLLCALLSERGRAIEELLVKYLAFAWGIFDQTPECDRVTSAEVQAALGLSDTDVDLLGRLIFFDGLFGAGGGSGQGWWQAGLPHGVEDIADDARGWLHAKLLATYRPGLPTGSPDRERHMFDRSDLKPVVEYDRGGMVRLPAPLIADVAASVSDFYTHSQINNVFRRNGAPGDPPLGNKVDKITIWLERADADGSVDVHALLGGVLHEFMERELPPEGWGSATVEKCERVTRALAKHGLSYGAGGRIFGGTVSLPTKSLDALIRERNLPEIEKEFQRALENVEADPATAITAACAIVESTCKAYIAEEGLTMPADQSVQPLWKAVKGHLNLDPSKHVDTELRQMLSGLTSIVHGVGGLRTRRGSAHGHGPGTGAIEPRHARLAVHAAHLLVAFVLESWKAR